MLTEEHLNARTGPVLSDGSTIRDLFDLDRREISLRVLSDPEIYRLELRRVHARSWHGLGHVCEIPNVGDFVQRFVGEDPVMLTRTADGEVHVVLNVCAHRGMEVCWADEGNQTQFKCPYHGWVFDGAGNLLGAPFEQEMYGDWDKSEFSLQKAKVAVYHGFIFANFDQNAVPFDEWLGDLYWYTEKIYTGMESVDFVPAGTPLRLRMKANWKTHADQNAGDLYHFEGGHNAVRDLGVWPNINDWMYAVKVNFARTGHNLMGFEKPFYGATGLDTGESGQTVPTGYEFDGRQWNFLIFPGTTGGGLIGDEPAPFCGIQTVVPQGPNGLDLVHMNYIRSDLAEGLKTKTGGGAAHAALSDDIWVWESMQRGASGALGERRTMKYNAHRGESRPENWPGPGTVYAGFSRDDTHWEFWLRWLDMMTMDEI